jgi:hypothetical protein
MNFEIRFKKKFSHFADSYVLAKIHHLLSQSFYRDGAILFFDFYTDALSTEVLCRYQGCAASHEWV